MISRRFGPAPSPWSASFVLLAAAAAPLPAQQPAANPPAVAVVDLTPKFLAFYDSARALNADPDRRFQLWQQMVGFAAVPPGDFGAKLARRLLDSAWARYPGALDVIRRGAAGLGVSPDSALRQVVALLGCGRQTRIRLTVFVGGFEGNAFAFGVMDGYSNIALPVEAGDQSGALVHEFTHAIHRDGCVTFSTSYGGTVAEVVVTEGLAMRVVQRLVPGHDEGYYTGAALGWLEAAGARRDSLLRGIRDHLEDRGAEAVQRFTFGSGTTGLPRDAYYAGWEVVGVMLARMGMTFHDVATTPPELYPRLIGQAIDSLLVKGEQL